MRDHASPRRVSFPLQAGSELLASPLLLPILSRHACSARFSSLSWFSASSWWTTNTSSLTGARGRAWVDVPAPPNTSCGLLSTGSSDWEQTLWLGKARRPSCPTVANGWWTIAHWDWVVCGLRTFQWMTHTVKGYTIA